MRGGEKEKTPVQRGYKADFDVGEWRKGLKENAEKRKTAVIRKRNRAKTADFSAFRSVE